MNFVVIYQNNPYLRQSIFGQLVDWSKKIDFEKQGINGQGFQITPSWPDADTLKTFALNLQVEAVSVEGDVIITKRKLIVDVETVKEEETKQLELLKKE